MMFGYGWRILLAAMGLFGLRFVLYRRIWGHGVILKKTIGSLVCLLLVLPLVRFAYGALPVLVAVGVLWLFPYRELYLAFLKRSARKGLEGLATDWGVALDRDPEGGFCTASRRMSENGTFVLWAGHAIHRMRSIHPAVSTRADASLLAFVCPLDGPSPLSCSLARGWRRPSYFEREWRLVHTMQGAFTSLSMGGLLGDKGRETGGKVEQLQDAMPTTDERFRSFHGLRVTDPILFDRVFSGELLDDLFASAARSYPYEFNITPSSVNILTNLCGYEAQKAHVLFLEKVAERLRVVREEIPSEMPSEGIAKRPGEGAVKEPDENVPEKPDMGIAEEGDAPVPDGPGGAG
jgi:hypothetical protein